MWVKPGMMVTTFAVACWSSACCRRIKPSSARVQAARPEAEVGRHLVVTRARSVQAPGGRSSQFGQTGFDVEVDVLEGALEFELAVADFRLDGCQPLRMASRSAREMMPWIAASWREHGCR